MNQALRMLYKPERFKQTSLAPNFHTAVLSRGAGLSSNKFKRIINAKDSPNRKKPDDDQLVHTDEEEETL